jgi:hypothetical protein
MTLAAMVLAGCEPDMLPVEDIPTTLRMTLGDGTRSGCPGDGPLLEFEESLTFRLEALDTFGQPFPYTGPVGFHMSPGRLANPGLRQTMVQGSLVIPPEAALEVRLAFGGRAHVWAELLGEDGRQATGLSPDLCFKTPKIADVQRHEDSHKTHFDGEQVRFRGDRLVATAVDSKGFYVSDIDSPEYGSIYVFTFRNPTGVKPGSCMCEVSGAVQEFLHFTEIIFPTWRVFKPGGRDAAAVELEEERIRVGDDEVPDPRDDESVIFEDCALADPADLAACSLEDPVAREALTVPKPIRLEPESLPDVGVPPWDDKMVALDRHEGSLVAIGPVHLPRQFTNCDVNGDGDVARCFSTSCPALRTTPEHSVRDTVCGGGQPAGGCQCTCNDLRESFCTNDCAKSPGCAERAAYEQYGQFGVTAGDADRRINLITEFGLPDFKPTEDPHTTIHCVVGNLKQVAAAPIPWVIQPRRPSDVMFDPPASIEDDPCAER